MEAHTQPSKLCDRFICVMTQAQRPRYIILDLCVTWLKIGASSCATTAGDRGTLLQTANCRSNATAGKKEHEFRHTYEYMARESKYVCSCIHGTKLLVVGQSGFVSIMLPLGHTYIHADIHTYVHTYIHTYMHICVQAYTESNTHAYLYTHTCTNQRGSHSHAYICQQMHACMQNYACALMK